MKKDLLIKYIKNINKDNIKHYLDKEHINYNETEIEILYNSIHNDYEEIINDFNKYILNYKLVLNEELYIKIIKKYNEYKYFLQ